MDIGMIKIKRINKNAKIKSMDKNDKKESMCFATSQLVIRQAIKSGFIYLAWVAQDRLQPQMISPVVFWKKIHI